jgi:cytochrome c peroxidase
MHDGRFLNLEAVLEHYNSQVAPTPNLDPILTNGTTRGIPLTKEERVQLIAFLATLDDRNFITNPLIAEQ